MKIYLSLFLPVVLSIPACGTIATQFIPGETCSYAAGYQDRWGCRGIRRVYSGVAANLCWLPSEWGLVTLIDLPLSLVGDTLILPLTTYQQREHGNLCAEKDAGQTNSEDPDPEIPALRSQRQASPSSFIRVFRSRISPTPGSAREHVQAASG